MAYKFQLGAARLSGSLVQEGGISAESSALSGSSLDIGNANLSEAELEVLDGAAAGTGAAEKALILDSSRDIANINRLTAAELGAFTAKGAIDFDNQNMTNVDIDSGAIDGTVIGAGSAAAASFTTINASSTSTLAAVTATTVSGSGAAQFASLHVDSVNLDGGNIDGTIIGAAAAAAGTFTSLQGTVVTATTAFTGSISGSLIQGGMANFGAGGVSVQGNVEGVDALFTNLSASNDLDVVGASRFGPANSAIIAADGGLTITHFDAGFTNAGNTIADLGSVTTADINGGTIDSVAINASAIGAASQASGQFTTLSASSTLDVVGAARFGPGNDAIIAADGGLTITHFDANFTNAGNTIADLGSVTTADINGGSIDGTVIGAASAAAGSFTTINGTVISASTAFTGSISGSLIQGAMANFGAGGVSVQGNIEAVDASFTNLSSSAKLEVGGTVQLDGVAALSSVNVDAAADSIYMLDATDDLMKKVTMANYAAKIAGNALTSTNGVLAVNPDNSSIEIHAGFDRIRVKSLGITNGMLAGSITNAKLVNDSVTLTAGAGMAALGSVDLGASITVAVDGVLEDLDTLGAASSDGQFIVATGAGAFAYESGNTARTSLGLGTSDSPSFAGLTVNGDLLVTGSLTYVNTTNLSITDALITIGSGSSAFGAGYGLEFGAMGGGWASLKTATVDVNGDGSNDNALSASLPFIATSVTADTFFGSFAIKRQAIGDANGTLQSGVNYGSAAFTAARQWTLPASPELGASVKVKAHSVDVSNYLEITASGAQKIDDNRSSIILESPYAAVELVYVAADQWRVF